jgi:hypothetical protein
MTMSKFLSVALLASASAIAAFVPIQAEAVPVATWGGSFVTINGSVDQNQEVTFTGETTFGTRSVSTADGSASVQSTPTPLPAITSTATANATATAAEATATLNYWLNISGPGVIPASVNVIASGSLFSDIGATSSDFLNVAGGNIVNVTSIGGNNNGAFTTSATVSSLFTNVDYLIEMNAFALAHPSGTATTFFDPFFFLDQSLVDLGYSITVSPGIGNSLEVASATPLPAALPLFATGIGAFGLLGWRRKKKATALAA